MKYKVSAKRIKIELWFLVIILVYFSISLIRLSSLQYRVTYILILLSSIFLLWGYYQVRKQKNGLLKFCSILSFTLFAVRIITLLINWSLEALILSVPLSLIYLDVGLFFRNMSRKKLEIEGA